MDARNEKRTVSLSACPLFAGLPDDDRTRAARLLRATEKAYARGESLHRAGEPFSRFGLVLSGRVEVCRLDLSGEEALMASVGPGGTFGESLAYLGTENAPVCMTAPDGARVLWLDPAPLTRTRANGDPLALLLADRLTAMMARRALELNERIQILSKLSLREKLKTYFETCARQAGQKTFSVPFDRAGLAAYLGANRAALSRELSRMRQDGLLDYYRDSFRILW